jgi:hypothetical protein
VPAAAGVSRSEPSGAPRTARRRPGTTTGGSAGRRASAPASSRQHHDENGGDDQRQEQRAQAAEAVAEEEEHDDNVPSEPASHASTSGSSAVTSTTPTPPPASAPRKGGTAGVSGHRRFREEHNPAATRQPHVNTKVLLRLPSNAGGQVPPDGGNAGSPSPKPPWIGNGELLRARSRTSLTGAGPPRLTPRDESGDDRASYDALGVSRRVPRRPGGARAG